MTRRTPSAAASLAAAVLLVASPAARADWIDESPYYEHDAWYDVSEWFDGNDYNPTDESVFRWDNETYDAADAATESGADYGYSDGTTDRWFYDYYDPYAYDYYPNYGYTGSRRGTAGSSGASGDTSGGNASASAGGSSSNTNGSNASAGGSDSNAGNAGSGGNSSSSSDLNSFVSHYYDFDRDGVYDAVSTYADTNNDGRFERYAYYSFDTIGGAGSTTRPGRQGAQSQDPQRGQQRDQTMRQQGQQQSMESRRQNVAGQVEQVKDVRTRGGTHALAMVKADDGQTRLVDLGPKSDLKQLGVDKGKQLRVSGPMTKVGDKSVLLADRVSVGDQTRQIDRNRQTFKGKIVDTRKATVRGQQLMFAIVDTNRVGKVAVDLGRADRAGDRVKQGSELTFTGVPVNVRGGQGTMRSSQTQQGQQQQQQQQRRGGDQGAMQTRQGNATSSQRGQTVILAREYQVDGDWQAIDRRPMTIGASGKNASTRPTR